jgi:hypothetical protein
VDGGQVVHYDHGLVVLSNGQRKSPRDCSEGLAGGGGVDRGLGSFQKRKSAKGISLDAMVGDLMMRCLSVLHSFADGGRIRAELDVATD